MILYKAVRTEQTLCFGMLHKIECATWRVGEGWPVFACCFVAAVYNWKGDTRFGLALEIGDTVQIQEECLGELKISSKYASRRFGCVVRSAWSPWSPLGAPARPWVGNPFDLHARLPSCRTALESSYRSGECRTLTYALHHPLSLTLFTHFNSFSIFVPGWYRGFATKNRTVKVILSCLPFKKISKCIVVDE